ncbi:hypothetical protein PV05_02622 [Exophiala xenobiotica]|uniref:Uncharacterized protein n=1 Tax=Exophiala xenobiotica TaxID=348802 RepID=A0A0D2D6Y9_9EURO|nr:uncharacterized protein PV05_02622 [Exophiala xenobiotica]KIW58072.1 hypothetical protein PV05_02622 [Exophiala xenobiotica]
MSSGAYCRIEISCLEGRAQSVRFRQKLFHSLYNALKSSASALREAIAADSGNGEAEVALELALALSELRTHYDTLNLEEELKEQRSLENLNATTNIGIIYVIPAKQNLYYSVISALTAALAAGNCVIVELPPTLTQVSGLLRKILPSALDADVFTISSTRPSETFLSKCRVLAQTDEDQATSSPSQLSAKVVAVVDRTANVSEAASVVSTSRVSFNGRSAYAPDIVLVNEFVADDFLFHLVQAITSPMSTTSPTASQARSKTQPDPQSPTMKEVENTEGLRIIMSGANGSIVEVRDRTKVALGRRIAGRVIMVCRITSLDDAIDLCNGFGTPLEASYAFAAPTEANYLARFIDARISCVNHIPTELLIGPFAPKHPTIAPSPSPRYPSTLFRSPRPRLAQASNLTEICREIIRSRSTKSLESWARATMEPPLPAIKQADGRATGFFDQALMVIGGTAVSVLAGSAYILFRVLRKR